MKLTPKNTAPAILLTTALMCAACSQTPSGAAPIAGKTDGNSNSPEIEVARVIAQNLSTTVKLPAQLTAYEIVDVYPKVTGFLKSINVDRGSRVRAGQAIAQLEAPELLAQKAEAESKFQSAQSLLSGAQAKYAADQATFKRMTEAAHTPGVVAKNDLDIAEKSAQADKAAEESMAKSAAAAQEALRAVSQLEAYLTIVAPFDGQVTNRYVHPGALVGAAGGPGAMTPIAQIQTLTRLRLVVPVPEYDAAGIPVGTQVSFTVPSFPGRSFSAPIARISGAVDVKTRTMPVELDVRDPAAELDPGTFCDVTWPLRRSYPTLFVPATAVANDQERSFVIRVRDNRAEWVDVKTGAAAGKLIEIFGELSAGDQVAIRGTDQIRSGASVTVHSGD